MSTRSLVLVMLVFATGAATGCMSEDRVSDLAGDAAADQVYALEQKVGELETHAGEISALEQQVGQLEARVDDMEWRLEDACSRLGC